jgi:hypothetical protein
MPIFALVTSRLFFLRIEIFRFYIEKWIKNCHCSIIDQILNWQMWLDSFFGCLPIAQIDTDWNNSVVL